MHDDTLSSVNAARSAIGLEPLVAVGVPGEGNDNWKHQLRDRFGKWIEMGGHIKWSVGGIMHTGKVTGIEGEYAVADMATPGGGVKHGVKIHHSQVEVIHEKAELGKSVLDSPFHQEQKQKLDATPKDITGVPVPGEGDILQPHGSNTYFPHNLTPAPSALQPGDKVLQAEKHDNGTLWRAHVVNADWKARNNDASNVVLDTPQSRAILKAAGGAPYTGDKKADVPSAQKEETPAPGAFPEPGSGWKLVSVGSSGQIAHPSIVNDLNEGDKIHGIGPIGAPYMSISHETYTVEKPFTPDPNVKAPFSQQPGTILVRRDSDGKLFNVNAYRQSTALRDTPDVKAALGGEAPKPETPAPADHGVTHDVLANHADFAWQLVDQYELLQDPQNKGVATQASKLEALLSTPSPDQEAKIKETALNLASALDDFSADPHYDPVLPQDTQDKISEAIADLENYADPNGGAGPDVPKAEIPAPEHTPTPAVSKGGVIHPPDEQIVTADDLQPGDKIIETTAADGHGGYKSTGETLEVTKPWANGQFEFKRADGTTGTRKIDRFDDVVLADPNAAPPSTPNAPIPPTPEPAPKPEPVTQYDHAQMVGGFAPGEYEALISYIGSGHGPMNSYLRTGEDAHPQTVESVDNLKSLIEKNTLVNDTQLWRGVHDKQLLGQLEPGAILTDKGFMSFSSDQGIAENFSGGGASYPWLNQSDGAVVHITAPKGTHALDVEAMIGTNVDEYSEPESEIILSPGTSITIDSVKTNGKGVLEVKAHISTPEELKNGHNAGPDTHAAPVDVPGGATPEPGGAPHLDQPGPGADHTPAPGGGPVQFGLSEYSSPVTSSEETALASYTFTGYIEINTGLRTGEFANPAAETDANKLAGLVGKSKLTEDVKLYRGISNKALPDTLEPGTVVSDKAFMSASRYDDVASMFGSEGAVFEFTVPEGEHALDVTGITMPHIDPHNKEAALDAGSEGEFIMPPGAGLRVISDKHVMGERIIKAEYVPPGAHVTGKQIDMPANSESVPPATSFPDTPNVPNVAGAPGEKSFHVLPDPGANGDGYYEGTHLWGKYGAAGVMLRHTDENGQERYLLVQRGPMVSSNKGKWQLPGGALNGNENDYQGTARELTEELAPPAGYLDKISPKGEVLFNHPSGWHYNNITADVPEQFTPHVDGTETGDAKWVTADELVQMHHDGQLHPALAENLPEILKTYDTPGEHVETASPTDAKALADEATPAAPSVPDAPNAPYTPGPGEEPLADWEKELLGYPDAKLDTQGLISTANWEKVGAQGGSNPGGTYKAPDGKLYYVKQSQSEDHARNEVLARKLYDLTGIDSAQLDLVDVGNGKLGTASPIIPGAKQDLNSHLNDPAYLQKLQEGFGTDAWTANWDVAGLTFDNVVTDANGNPVRVDPGGALLFRAQGAPKKDAWGDTVGELNTLKTSPQAGKIFGQGKMDPAVEKASAQRVVNVTDAQINDAVDSVGFDPQTADQLKDTLKARRDYIAKHYGLTPQGAETPAPAPETPAEPPAPEAPSAPTPEAPAEHIDAYGVPIQIGAKVRSLSDNKVYTVLKYESNGTGVQVLGPDGKKYGRKKSMLAVVPDTPADAAPADTKHFVNDFPAVTEAGTWSIDGGHLDVQPGDVKIRTSYKNANGTQQEAYLVYRPGDNSLHYVGGQTAGDGQKLLKQMQNVGMRVEPAPETPNVPDTPSAAETLPALESHATWTPAGVKLELQPGDKPFTLVSTMNPGVTNYYVYRPSEDRLIVSNGASVLGAKGIIDAFSQNDKITMTPAQVDAPNVPEAPQTPDVPSTPDVPNVNVNGPSALDAHGNKIYVGSQVKSATDGKIYTIHKFESNGTGAQVIGPDGKKYGRKLKTLEAVNNAPSTPAPEAPSAPEPTPTPEPPKPDVPSTVDAMPSVDTATTWNISGMPPIQLEPGDKPMYHEKPSEGGHKTPFVYRPSTDQLITKDGYKLDNGKQLIANTEKNGATYTPADDVLQSPNPDAALTSPAGNLHYDLHSEATGMQWHAVVHADGTVTVTDDNGDPISVAPTFTKWIKDGGSAPFSNGNWSKTPIPPASDEKYYDVTTANGTQWLYKVSPNGDIAYSPDKGETWNVLTEPHPNFVQLLDTGYSTQYPGWKVEPWKPSAAEPGPAPDAKVVGTMMLHDKAVQVHEGDKIYEYTNGLGDKGYYIAHPDGSATGEFGVTPAPEGFTSAVDAWKDYGLNLVEILNPSALPEYTKGDKIPDNVDTNINASTGPHALDAYGNKMYIGSTVKSLTDGKTYTVVKFESNGTGAQVKDENGKKVGRKLNKLKVLDPGSNAPANGTPVSNATVDAYTPIPTVSGGEIHYVIKQTGTLEPNPSSPWFNQPEPQAPTLDTSAVTPWVSDRWVQDAKDAYKAWPEKKGKPLEDSNNWVRFKKVMEQGSVADLEHLNMKGYFSQKPELYDQAKESIANALAANTKLADDYKAAHAKYVTDLHDWKLANGISTNPTQIPGLPQPSTTPFTGGEADWNKAHPGTPTLAAALDAVNSSNVVATHGVSFAGDSDQIEDLDVRVTKFVGADGVTKLHLQFKLTSWAGDELAPSWDEKGTATPGLTVFKTIDNGDGLRKRLPQTNTDASVSKGLTYVLNDENSGAIIRVHRGHRDKAKGYNGEHLKTQLNDHTTQNLVQIDLPENATPEDVANALKAVGVRDVRPSTEQDVRLLAENRMMSIFGMSTDPTKNSKTASTRQKKLAEIEAKYGITIQDLYLAPGVNGRMRLVLSDSARDKLIERTKVKQFTHSVSDAYDVNRWHSILAGQLPGLMPTSMRFLEGNGEIGMSSQADWKKGSAEWMFTKPKHNVGSTVYGDGYVAMHPAAMLRRTDIYGNINDAFGERHASTDPYNVVAHHGAYEVTFKGGVPVSDFWYVAVDPSVRAQLISKLQSQGIDSINGIPIEDFILSAGMPIPEIDPSTWSSGQLQPISSLVGQPMDAGAPDVIGPVSGAPAA